DGIFAIIITIMVLDLKKPEKASFEALARLWPVWVAYIASYWLIAIVWVNHHYLLKNAIRCSPKLIWANFGHMFVVSLIPFLTAWIAESELAPLPVALYAFVFFLLNLSYLALIYQTIPHHHHEGERARRLFRLRSVGTLVVALVATGLAFWSPGVGYGI